MFRISPFLILFFWCKYLSYYLVPAGAPQNFTVTGVSETTIKLEWDLPAKHLQNGEILMYQLTYHKLADPTNWEDMNLTSIEYTITGLDMNTDYVFQIRAFTSKGAGPWTTKLIFHTYGRSTILFEIFGLTFETNMNYY